MSADCFYLFLIETENKFQQNRNRKKNYFHNNIISDRFIQKVYMHTYIYGYKTILSSSPQPTKELYVYAI